MATETIVDAVSLRSAIQLTPGRQALVASQMRARFTDEEARLFGPLADELAREAERAVALARARNAQREPTYGADARGADAALDASLSTLHVLANAYVRAHAAGTDAGAAARVLLEKLFPRGLAATVQAPFPEQLAQTRALLAAATTPAVAAAIAVIPGAAAVVAEIASRTQALRDALDREARDGVSHRDVVAANDRAERRLAELVAGIVFHHRGDTQEAVARRIALLEPYGLQVDAMRERYRRRAGAGDVDPSTGEEVEVPGASSVVGSVAAAATARA